MVWGVLMCHGLADVLYNIAYVCTYMPVLCNHPPKLLSRSHAPCHRAQVVENRYEYDSVELKRVLSQHSLESVATIFWIWGVSQILGDWWRDLQKDCMQATASANIKQTRRYNMPVSSSTRQIWNLCRTILDNRELDIDLYPMTIDTSKDMYTNIYIHAMCPSALWAETCSLAYNISQIFYPILDRSAIDKYQFKIQSVYFSRVSSSASLMD